jgi:6-phosphofructokinase 1
VIRAVVLAGRNRGWDVVGIRDGFNGLMFPERYRDGGVVPLPREVVRGIVHLGGTILGTTNRGNPFRRPTPQPDGTLREVDRSADLLEAFRRERLDALIAVGGDGSLTIAQGLHAQGLRVVGVPKTIDNDLEATTLTFGFQSAVAFGTECIDRLHSTTQAHRRVMVVEVMGRHAGWIALNCGIAGMADVILIPEIPFDLARVAAHLEQRLAAGKTYAIVVVAEGAHAADGEAMVRSREMGRADRLGGVGERVAAELQERTKRETRTVVLGHLLRGGSPIALDRILGLGFGTAAVRALAEGHDGVMVALNPPRIDYVPLRQAVEHLKRVPLDGEAMLTARSLGIAFGD